MGLFAWLILGGIAGAIAKAIMSKVITPGREYPGGFWLTIVLGAAGGFLGGGVSSLVFGADMGGLFDLRSWFIAVAGALVILVAYRLLHDKFGKTSSQPELDSGTNDSTDSGDHAKLKKK